LCGAQQQKQQQPPHSRANRTTQYRATRQKEHRQSVVLFSGPSWCHKWNKKCEKHLLPVLSLCANFSRPAEQKRKRGNMKSAHFLKLRARAATACDPELQAVCTRMRKFNCGTLFNRKEDGGDLGCRHTAENSLSN
jgi:hypothetical protein